MCAKTTNSTFIYNRILNGYNQYKFENYKRRTAKERIELFKTAGKDVLSSLVPVLEDFKRAISLEGSDSDDEGIKLIYNKFNETLRNQGLFEVEVNINKLLFLNSTIPSSIKNFFSSFSVLMIIKPGLRKVMRDI